MSIDTQIQSLLRKMSTSPSDATLVSLYQCCTRAGKELWLYWPPGPHNGNPICITSISDERPQLFEYLEYPPDSPRLSPKDPPIGTMYYLTNAKEESDVSWILDELLAERVRFVIGNGKPAKQTRREVEQWT